MDGDILRAYLRFVGFVLAMIVAVLVGIAFCAGRCSAAEDALDEVNAVRARKRLPPFERVECLTVAAKNCADYRAEHRIAGHTRNDFAYLPQGCHAEAAGCAGWRPALGWGACCTYERWRYAGAAWAMGRNGVRYMHIFVSNRRCQRH